MATVADETKLFRHTRDRKKRNQFDSATLKKLEELDEKWSKSPPDASGYFQFAANHMLILKRVADGEIVGKLEYRVEGDVAHLLWICAPGFGRELVTCFEKFAAEDHGAKTVRLTVFGISPVEQRDERVDRGDIDAMFETFTPIDNTAVMEFYRKLGYEVKGQERNGSGDALSFNTLFVKNLAVKEQEQ